MRVIYFVLLVCFAACSGNEHQKKRGNCSLVTDHRQMYWDTVQTEAGTIVLMNDVIRDTITIDFIVEIKDANTNAPIESVSVEIVNKISQKTDSSGKAHFKNFHNDDGKFNIKLNHSDYACIEIDSLSFKSGQVKWFEVYLRKQLISQ